MKAIGYKT